MTINRAARRAVRGSKRVAVAAAVSVLLAAVGGCNAAPGGPSAIPSATPSSAGSGRQPVLIDTDLGADDILAIATTLADPNVDVRAITIAGTGLVHCLGASPHLQSLLTRLGVASVPVACGRELADAPAVAFPSAWRSGADSGYGLRFPATHVALSGDAADLINEAARAAAGRLMVLELGPWTNLADALAADRELAKRVSGIHAMGGTIDHPGNTFKNDELWSAPVEANLAADPTSAAAVLATAIPVMLVPLDATDTVPVPEDVAARLISDHAAAAADVALELFARNPFLASPGQFLWDETAAVAFLDPSLVTWNTVNLEISVAPETPGGLTRSSAGREVRVATVADGVTVVAALLAGLRRGPTATEALAIGGPVTVTSGDGACSLTTGPEEPGLTLLQLDNRGTTPASVVLVTAAAPHSLQDIIDLAKTYDPTTDQPPDWVTLVAQLRADTGNLSFGTAELASAPTLPICGIGDPSTQRLVVGTPFTPGG